MDIGHTMLLVCNLILMGFAFGFRSQAINEKANGRPYDLSEFTSVGLFAISGICWIFIAMMLMM